MSDFKILVATCRMRLVFTSLLFWGIGTVGAEQLPTGHSHLNSAFFGGQFGELLMFPPRSWHHDNILHENSNKFQFNPENQ